MLRHQFALKLLAASALLPLPARTQARGGGLLDQLRFRSIGPATISGRVNEFAVYEKDPRIFYVATAGGGVWKTTGAGISMTPVFDSAGAGAIGAIAVSQRNPNLVWVGTGDVTNRVNAFWGDGVYRSTDGGQTWHNVGLAASRNIGRIAIDPSDDNVVYVAAQGDPWSTGGERGIYKTSDGGKTWAVVLAGETPDMGAGDVLIDPSNPQTVYASLYRRRGLPGFYLPTPSGPGGGVFKSVDGGQHWTRLTNGLPTGYLGLIVLKIHRRNSQILLAKVQGDVEASPEAHGLYRSDDGGSSWRKVNKDEIAGPKERLLEIDPSNDQRIYSNGAVSEDGGKTFKYPHSRIYGDFQSLWINPSNSDHLLVSSDGGAYQSHDRGKSWVWLQNIAVEQLYRLSVDNQEPYSICAGIQDHGIWCGPSRVKPVDSKAWMLGNSIRNDHWRRVQFSDGVGVAIDPGDSRYMYGLKEGGNYWGANGLGRSDRLTNEGSMVGPSTPRGERMRWNWEAAFAISPHSPATLYYGGNRLFRSTDRGNHWSIISPDLTHGGAKRDTAKLRQILGIEAAPGRYQRWIEQYGALIAIAESPRKRGVIYTGSDDGVVQVTKDNGRSWTDLTPNIPNAPPFSYVTRIEPSTFEDGTVYVAFDAHMTGDHRPYLFRSTDYGATWTSVGEGLPAGQVIHSLALDRRNANVLYVGTWNALYASVDRGATWIQIRANLPPTPIYDMAIQPRDNALILGTHGRGIWILDDLAPIQEYAAAREAGKTARPWLVTPPRVVGEIPLAGQGVSMPDRYSWTEGNLIFFGENAAPGTTLWYYLSERVNSIRITVQDGAGKVVRTIDPAEPYKPTILEEMQGAIAVDNSVNLQPGFHAVGWDLQRDKLPSQKPIRPEYVSQAAPPMVMPGRYSVSLIVNGKEHAKKTLAILPDPARPIADADRRQRQELREELQRLERAMIDARNTALFINDTLVAVRKGLEGNEPSASARVGLDSLTRELDAVRHSLGIWNQGENRWASDAEEDVIQTIVELAKNIDGILIPVGETVRSDVARLRARARTLGTSVDGLARHLAQYRGRGAASAR
jgi:photosystem II stability/assembly factor-like uncharacterized protein